MVSIIIPVWRESATINCLLAHLVKLDEGVKREVVLVDGEKGGGTLEAVDKGYRVRKIKSPAGRARQMNAGAARAKGDVLLFLHADTFLPKGALSAIVKTMRDKKYVGGAFELEFESQRPVFKMIAWVTSLRSRLTRVPYGDQGIFMRREYFNGIGGYKEIPLMEDVELMRRVKRCGDEIAILWERVSTSPRRYEKRGVLRQLLRNRLISALYCMGVSPNRLASIYH